MTKRHAQGVRGLYDARGYVNVCKLAAVLGESIASMAAAVRVTPSALTKTATCPKAQPIAASIAAVYEHALRTFGDSKDAVIWLRTPMARLERKSPLDIVKAGHPTVVDDLLTAIDTGQPA